VDHGLIVKVADVERAVGPDARLDRTPPHVLAPHEFRLLAARQFLRGVAAAFRREARVMDQVDRRQSFMFARRLLAFDSDRHPRNSSIQINGIF
jgi:hypothetical protein